MSERGIGNVKVTLIWAAVSVVDTQKRGRVVEQYFPMSVLLGLCDGF